MFEPINVFSNRVDPAGVLDVLDSVAKEVAFEGPRNNWTKATAYGPKRMLGRRSALIFTHDADYYSDSEWPMQMYGMAGYLSKFPDGPRKESVLMLPSSFHFALSFPECDLDIESNDARLAWLYAVCAHLDGVIFTPSALRDAQGRILLSAGGEYDEAASLPKVRAEVKIDSSTPGDDDQDESEPPSPERVAQRALILTAIANRGLIENENGSDETREGMLEWIRELGIEDELEPDELEVLETPIGSLDLQAAINAAWSIEGLAVLAWALGVCDLPPYDTLVTPAKLLPAMSIFDVDRAQKLMREASLPVPETLEQKRIELLMVHWRAVEFSVRQQACDFEALSQKCWFGTFDLAPYQIVKKDLALGGNAFSEADPDLISTVHSLSMERHRAINWLCGDQELYSETYVGT